MTDDQHRQIGALLGYPPCCVEAWVTDPERPDAAVRRGSVLAGQRDEADAAVLNERISALLGRRWNAADEIRYVPCEAHVGSAGWSPFN